MVSEWTNKGGGKKRELILHKRAHVGGGAESVMQTKQERMGLRKSISHSGMGRIKNWAER